MKDNTLVNQLFLKCQSCCKYFKFCNFFIYCNIVSNNALAFQICHQNILNTRFFLKFLLQRFSILISFVSLFAGEFFRKKLNNLPLQNWFREVF